MERGEAMSYRAIAKKAGVNRGYVQTILLLAFLVPVLTRELLDGRRQLHGPLMVRMREAAGTHPKRLIEARHQRLAAPN